MQKQLKQPYFLEKQKKKLKIIITDDGIGMDAKLVHTINNGLFENIKTTHFGLRNIFERTKLLDGTVTYFPMKTLALVLPWRFNVKMKKTFYIIDDHELLRLGTTSYIQHNSDWIGCGSAGNEKTALDDLAQFSLKGELPSIIISDLNFYGKDTGFDLVKQLHELYPEQKTSSIQCSFRQEWYKTPFQTVPPVIFLKTPPVTSFFYVWKKSLSVRLLSKRNFKQI